MCFWDVTGNTQLIPKNLEETVAAIYSQVSQRINKKVNIFTDLQVETVAPRATTVSQTLFMQPRALKPLTAEGTLNTKEPWHCLQAKFTRQPVQKKQHGKAVHVASSTARPLHAASHCE